MVGVEGENLVLRVALLELKRDEPLLDLSLETLGAGAREDATAHVVLEEQHPRDLLRDRARATHAMAGAEVANRRDDQSRHAHAEVTLELGVLAGDDGLPQRGRDVFVANDDAAFGGELTDLLSVGSHQPGNGAWLVVVERADRGHIVCVDERQPAECAQKGGNDEERKKAGLPCEPDDDPGAWLDR
jgi:hypothetical protein